jgi:hypothetical protein
MRILYLSLFYILLSYFAHAQSAPKYSNEFLSVGVGARALGMSNTFSAVCDDVTSGYWNPAGLTEAEGDYQAALMHTSYFAGIANYDYGAFCSRLDSANVIGFSLIRFGIDDIPDTRYLVDANNGTINYDRVGSFAEASYAFLFSYGRKVWLRYHVKDSLTGQKIEKYFPVSFGANFKVINRTAGIFSSAWGFGMDFGAKLKVKKWQIGLTAMDITGTFNAYSFNSAAVEEVFTKTGNEIPVNSVEITLPRLQAGLARNWQIGQKFNFLAAAGAEITFDGKRNTVIKSNLLSLSPSFGFEVGYANLAFLRGGIGNFSQITEIGGKKVNVYQPNFGAGLKIKKFNIDYAFTNIGNSADVPYSNVFSLRVHFGNDDVQKIKNKLKKTQQ